MLRAFQEALIEKISHVAKTRKYQGELSNLENAKMLSSELPLVMVDFVGDTHIGALKKVAEFNLYIVHISYSSNTQHREETKTELIELLERVDEAISSQSLAGSQYIQLKRARKLFDGKSNRAYLSVFMRTLQVELRI